MIKLLLILGLMGSCSPIKKNKEDHASDDEPNQGQSQVITIPGSSFSLEVAQDAIDEDLRGKIAIEQEETELTVNGEKVKVLTLKLQPSGTIFKQPALLKASLERPANPVSRDRASFAMPLSLLISDNGDIEAVGGELSYDQDEGSLDVVLQVPHFSILFLLDKGSFVTRLQEESRKKSADGKVSVKAVLEVSPGSELTIDNFPLADGPGKVTVIPQFPLDYTFTPDSQEGANDFLKNPTQSGSLTSNDFSGGVYQFEGDDFFCETKRLHSYLQLGIPIKLKSDHELQFSADFFVRNIFGVKNCDSTESDPDYAPVVNSGWVHDAGEVESLGSQAPSVVTFCGSGFPPNTLIKIQANGGMFRSDGDNTQPTFKTLKSDGLGTVNGVFDIYTYGSFSFNVEPVDEQGNPLDTFPLINYDGEVVQEPKTCSAE